MAESSGVEATKGRAWRGAGGVVSDSSEIAVALRGSSAMRGRTVASVDAATGAMGRVVEATGGGTSAAEGGVSSAAGAEMGNAWREGGVVSEVG